MLRRLEIYPNAYYNFLKNRKASYRKQKQEISNTISSIYHLHNGVDGYRSIRIYLRRQGISLSAPTVHKYMNVELKLYSVVRRKKPDYCHGNPHKVFENLLQQDLNADTPNQKWATDFTYLFLKDGSLRYNCAVIDLHDRSVVASVSDRNITSDLAIRTVKKALASQKSIESGLILHSDQGSQYTSKAFTDYCASVGITQSMSKEGYPYDNAPMERYYNTLKNELVYLHEYRSEDELYRAIEEFSYVWYNHVRPHAYNNYRTPFEARYNVVNY